MEKAVSTGQSRRLRQSWFSGKFNPLLQIFLIIITATIILVIGWNVFSALAYIILIFFVSVLIAYLIGPLVDRLALRMHRGLGIGLVYLVALPLAVLMLLLFLGPIVSQLGAVAKGMSASSAQKSETLANLGAYLAQNGVTIDMGSAVSQLAQFIKGTANSTLNILVSVASNLVSLVIDVLMILAVTFFLSLNGREVNVRLLRLVPDSLRGQVLFIEATVSRVIGGYIRAQIIVATIYGFLAGGGAWLLGVNYALYIGIAAFFLEFIPLVGPVLSMIIAVVISLFQPWPLVVWVTIYFIFIQQLESNVLEPKIGGRILGLHPVVVILAVLGGATLAGLLGAFLALPITAAVTTIAVALYLDIRGRTSLLIPHLTSGNISEKQRPEDTRPQAETSAKASDANAETLLSTPQTVTAAESEPDIMDGAPSAALMFKDRLEFVLKEQARLRAGYEEISAKQTAQERRDHGLPVAVASSQ